MPKIFYTERDIVDLARRGVTVIDVADNVVLTDLAREKALGLGMRLARSQPASAVGPAGDGGHPQPEVAAKVKAAVIARLGKEVDSALIDAVVQRVLAQIQ